MAANKCVVVLAPNGRRQNVKVTPNTTLLQVLEEVCRKQGLKPEEYDIKHHNHVLDTTAIMRFSGLPNNAQLEMAAAQKTRQESSVVLGLQLETGDRLMGDFLPTDSLWDVIKKLCPDEADPNSNPVIIYMRREVCGVKSLEETTLRSLGLTSGRAMLRFVHRTPEELRHQANVSGPLHQRLIEKFPPNVPSESDAPPEHPHDADIESSSTGGASSSSEKLFQSSAALSTLSSKTGTGQSIESSGNGKQSVTFPELTTADNISSSQSNITSINSQLSMGTERPKLSQKEEMDIGSYSSFGVDSNNTSTEVSSGSSEGTVAPIPERKENNEEIILLGERNAIAFSLEMAQTVPYEDLPDEFFEITREDISILIRDSRRRRSEMEEAPLTTNAQRSLEESKKVLSQLNQYRRTVIRIQFPDCTVLQGTFLPLETISTVMGFVKGHLENPAMEFHLYTTPPKNILKPGTRLVDGGCVPSAIVHFGINNPTSDCNTYLQEAIYTQFTSPSAATLAACRSRGIEPRIRAVSSPALAHPNRSGKISQLGEKSAVVRPDNDEAMDVDNGPSTSHQFPQGRPSSKVPKWFKPIK